MTATLEKSESKSIIDSKMDEALHLQLAAEQILMSCVREGREPDSRERILLRSNGLDDDAAIHAEKRRLRRVLDAMAAAGSETDFANAKSTSEEASQVATTEGPILRERIDELQKRLAAIEQADAVATRRVETMTAARETLSKVELMPPFVKELHQSAEFDLVQERQFLESWQSGLAMRRGAVKLRASDEEALFHLEARHDERYIRTVTAGNGTVRRSVDEQAWAELVEKYETEIPIFEQELANAKAGYDRRLRELCPLDWYTRQLEA